MKVKNFKNTVPAPQQQIQGLAEDTRVIVINEQVKSLKIDGHAVISGSSELRLIMVRKREADFDTAMQTIRSASSFDDGIDALLKDQLAADLGIPPTSF